MATYEDVQKSGGTLGKIINTVGNFLGNPLPDWNLSESLENWGGNLGSNFQWVKPVQAAEQPNYDVPLNPEGMSYTGTVAYPQKTVTVGTPTAPTGGSPSPQPSGGTSQQDIINAYKAMGWTDENAIMADYNATGGSKLGGSTGGGMSDALAGLKSTYNSAYDQVFSALDQFAGLIPGQQAQREQQVNNLYGTQQNEINTNMQGSLGALEGSKQNVAMKQAQAVRDLQENLRNMLQAGNIQLGIGGAGDSSAAGMLGYALSKQAARGSADISNQGMQQYGQIDAQGQQIRATADDQLAKLGTWKAENLNNVLTWAQEQVGAIQAQRVNATGQKAQALAAAEAGIIQSALSNLQNIDTQIATWKQGIQSWALNRLASLDDAKLKLGQLGKYDASDIVANELKGMNGNVSKATSSANMAGYNPWTTQKKEYTDFLSTYGK